MSEEDREKYDVAKTESVSVFTDLNEDDIVMGKGTDKLAQAIDHSVEIANRCGMEMMSFNCCCVPRIIGDDIYSVLKKAKETMGIPFMFQ